MANEPVLVCRGVTKRYGAVAALDAVDLAVGPGQVFGLLGPNGAGKTTLIRMILGLGLPTSGQIHLFGLDLFRRRREILRRVGAVIETPAFFEYLSGLENLRRLTALTARVPEKRLLDTLELVGLRHAARKKVGAYSYGMKQRLGIAQALLPDARFLVLDEPTNGLDPNGIAGVRNFIRDLARRRGLTVLVSSHLLAEIEQICDQVAILDHGRLILQAPVCELRNQAARLEVDLAESPQAAAALAETTGAAEVQARDGSNRVTLVYRPPPESVPELVRRLVHAGARILRVEPRHETLEEIFLRLTHNGDSGPNVRTDAF